MAYIDNSGVEMSGCGCDINTKSRGYDAPVVLIVLSAHVFSYVLLVLQVSMKGKDDFFVYLAEVESKITFWGKDNVVLTRLGLSASETPAGVQHMVIR